MLAGSRYDGYVRKPWSAMLAMLAPASCRQLYRVQSADGWQYPTPLPDGSGSPGRGPVAGRSLHGTRVHRHVLFRGSAVTVQCERAQDDRYRTIRRDSKPACQDFRSSAKWNIQTAEPHGLP